MPYTENFTEGAELLAKLDPQAIGGTTWTGYVSLANFHRFVVIVQTGAMTGTLNLALFEATSTAGDDAQSLTTTLLVATDDNQVTIFDMRCEQLTVNQDYDCIALELGPAAQSTSYVNVTIWGLEPRFRPAATTLIDIIVTN